MNGKRALGGEGSACATGQTSALTMKRWKGKNEYSCNERLSKKFSEFLFLGWRASAERQPSRAAAAGFTWVPPEAKFRVERGVTGFDGSGEDSVACPGPRVLAKQLGTFTTANSNLALAA